MITSTSRRFAFGLLLTVALSLTAFAGVFAYLQQQTPEVSALLPADTVGVGAVDAHWVWAYSDAIRSQPTIAKVIADVEQKSGISFDTDIASWIGRVAVAKLAGPPKSQNYVGFVEIRNNSAFENTLLALSNSAAAKASGSWSTATVDGRTVFQVTTPTGSPIAKVDLIVERNWIVVTPGDDVMQQLFNVWDNKTANLQSNPAYAKILAKINAPYAAVWAAGNPALLMPADMLAQAKTTAVTPIDYTGVSGASLIDKGNSLDVQMESVSHDPTTVAFIKSMTAGSQPINGNSLRTVPDEASFAFIIGSPSVWVNTIISYLAKAPAQASGPPFKMIAQVIRRYSDVYSPMTGEAVLSMGYTNGDFGVTFSAETASEESAKEVGQGVARLASQALPTIRRSGNEWTTQAPTNGISMFNPAMRVHGNYIELSSNRSWLEGPSGHSGLKLPADAPGSFEVILVNFKQLGSFLDMAQASQAPSASLAHILKQNSFENASFDAWFKIDPSYTSSYGVVELNNFDWKRTLNQLSVGLMLQRSIQTESPATVVPTPITPVQPIVPGQSVPAPAVPNPAVPAATAAPATPVPPAGA